MATFSGTKYNGTGSIPAKAVHQGVIAVSSKYTLAAALVLNDIIRMMTVPKGAQILEMLLSTDDLDTNGTPLIKFSVGDVGLTDRFIKQTTVPQAGGIAKLGDGLAVTLLSGAFGYKYTAETAIDVLVQTAPATGAVVGDVTLTVLYHLDA